MPCRSRTWFPPSPARRATPTTAVYRATIQRSCSHRLPLEKLPCEAPPSSGFENLDDKQLTQSKSQLKIHQSKQRFNIILEESVRAWWGPERQSLYCSTLSRSCCIAARPFRNAS